MKNRHLFQTNENFIARKSVRKFFVCNRHYYSQQMQQLLCDPDRYMKKEMLKIDHKTTLAICEIDNKKFVIKRYNMKNFWYGMKRALSPSRAAHCWRNSHQLLVKGILTPQPVALIENRFGPFRQEAFYIYEYLPGILAKDMFAKEPTVCEEKMHENVNKIVTLIKKMLANNFSHGDLKDENFIFHNSEFYFIDLDAMRFHRFAYAHKKAKLKDINRFLLNWKEIPKIHHLFCEKFFSKDSKN